MLERWIASFVELLKVRRFASFTIHICELVAMEFSLYMDGRVKGPRAITTGHVEAYLDARSRLFVAIRKRGTLASYRIRRRHALMKFVEYLHDQGVKTSVQLSNQRELAVLPEHDRLLGDFQSFMTKHRGFALSTINIYRNHASRLCRFARERGSMNWDEFSPQMLHAYVRKEARALGHLGLGNIISSIKQFFAFLRIRGLTTTDRSSWLIRPRTYGFGRVPKAVSLSQIKTVFRDVRGPSISDLRDRLILLFLAFYGLRIGDIARLRMEDVRWREGTITVHQRKTRKILTLPLEPAVAEVLREYVERARPRGTPFREILLTYQNPRPYPNGGSLAWRWARRAAVSRASGAAT